MALYIGMDLHSNNSMGVIVDAKDRVVDKARLPNRIKVVLDWLAPYRKEVVGVVVESTYNWYWLVDGLMEQGYTVHLANTVAIQQYSGLKHVDDESDARWLAKLLRLGELPEGHIYPRKGRAIRDLLRKRSQLVRLKTSNLLSIQNIYARNKGACLSANAARRLTAEVVDESFEDGNVAMAAKSNLTVMNCLEEQIWLLERAVYAQVGLRKSYLRLLSVPGIGKILGLTIMLETGDINRFEGVGNYVSYGRLVGSSYFSNGKRKGSGNTKNGNAFLCWAFMEAANFAIRYDTHIRRFYDRKKARVHRIVALKAVAHKIARACYCMIKQDTDFDVARAFS